MRTNSIVCAAMLAAISTALSADHRMVSLRASTSVSTGPGFFEGTCTPEKMTIRKEWRNLTDEEKAAYIKSQQCLFKLPSVSTLPGVTSRFDDFQAGHQAQCGTRYGDVIHYVGQFLPWHRFMLHALELTLRDECGYTGPMVWWDEQIDADSGNFFQSNMWDPITGFGGNGSEPDGCLETGPFANYTMHIGPGFQHSEYCLGRIWNEADAQGVGINSTVVDKCMATQTYDDFWNCVGFGPHRGGHFGVGGVMKDRPSAPGEPVFYLHHQYIDRMWMKWQQANGEDRLYWISGNTVNETAYPEMKGVNATLDLNMTLDGTIPDVTAREVMNTHGGYLCYDFDY